MEKTNSIINMSLYLPDGILKLLIEIPFCHFLCAIM
jgi:hypothetical protein